MKLKEKWAEEYVSSNQCEIMDTIMAHETTWLAGFNFALHKCGCALQEWEGVGYNAFDLIGSDEIKTGP